MGGLGSGNWLRFSSKPLVEKCLELDVSVLNKQGCLESWGSGICSWKDGSRINILARKEAIELSYSINGKNVSAYVSISWTTCNYGGKRPWFICPSEGCRRRVAKLYLRKGYFSCRHCHDLTYSSQRKTKDMRQAHKAGKDISKAWHKI